jgi:hypothetical protein
VIQHQAKVQTALSTGFYGGKRQMKARISSIMDIGKKRTGVAILCVILVATIATGATFAAASQINIGDKVVGPFQAIAGDLLNTCNFPIVLPGYLPSTPGGNEYQWSIIPDIKSDTYSIEIDQKKPEDTLGMYVGTVSGNIGEPAAQPLEQQFQNENVGENTISLPHGIKGTEYLLDGYPNVVGSNAITWEDGSWSFFVTARPGGDFSTRTYAEKIVNAMENSGQTLPGVQGKLYFIYNGNMPMTEIAWQNKNGVWYSLDWQDPVDALQILQNMASINNTDQVWKNSFYQSVNYDPDKNLLSFTIPETVPEGYRFYLHVSGRLYMGDKSSGMSFHAFDEESQNYSWVSGKTYTYPLDSGGLDFCLLDYGLVDNSGQGTLYNITVLPNGAKNIVMDQEESEPAASASAQPSEFSVNINGKAYELGSTNIIPLEAVKTQQIKDTASGKINSLNSYDGFSVLRDDKQSITSIEITSAGAATHRGITVGMTKNDVLKAYPEIDPAQQHIKGLWYDNGISRIDFYFNDSDTLTEIVIYND